MTIQELADRAAVTTRTIRYYVEQGVLPPPARGRPAEYTGEHLRLLDLIRRLKEQYLPLEEIRDMLQRLTSDQVEEFLRRTEPPQQAPQPEDSAADYISQVLTRGALRAQLKREIAPSPAQPPPPAQAPQQPAKADPVAPPPPARGPVRRDVGEARAATPSGQRTTSTYGQAAAARHDANQQEVPPMAEERTWQRVTLSPGVELHYEASTPGARPRTIHRLIEAARTILGSHPEKGTEEQQ
jgi:DNA-binding transcriptional MerR regulator